MVFSGRRGRHRTAQRDDDNADNDGDGGLLMIPDLEDDGEDEFAIKSTSTFNSFLHHRVRLH
jgi:hypothetical protein